MEYNSEGSFDINQRVFLLHMSRYEDSLYESHNWLLLIVKPGIIPSGIVYFHNGRPNARNHSSFYACQII